MRSNSPSGTFATEPEHDRSAQKRGFWRADGPKNQPVTPPTTNIEPWKRHLVNGCFWFPLKVVGGIIPQLAVYTTYIPLIIPTTYYQNLKNPLTLEVDIPSKPAFLGECLRIFFWGDWFLEKASQAWWLNKGMLFLFLNIFVHPSKKDWGRWGRDMFIQFQLKPIFSHHKILQYEDL